MTEWSSTYNKEQVAVLLEVLQDVSGKEYLGKDQHSLILYLQPLCLFVDRLVVGTQRLSAARCFLILPS